MVIKKSSDMPQGQRNGRSRLLNSIATRFSFVVVCLVISLLVSANTADARLQGGPPPGKFGMITCVPVIIDDEVYTSDDVRIDVEDDWECDMLDDDEYGNSNLITFSKKSRDFLASHGISSYQHLVTFKGRIRRTNGKEVIDIRTNFGITVEDYNQDVRRLRQKEGAYTILVIRVTDKDGHAPLEDQLELSNSVFGGGDDLHSLATQMDACSGGRLIYSPVVDDPSANTTGGVVDLHISNSVLDYGPYTRYDSTDMDRKQLEKDVMSELVENFPVYENWRNNAHVMIVFPREANFREEGRSGEAIAYAYVGGKKSVYKDPYGSQLWVQVHEIGHNNGLGHSGSWYGSTKKTYGDATCMMGSHSRGGDDAPLLCYNGAKNWHMGWYQYENGHETVPYSGTWEGKLIAIPDYLDVGNPDGAYRTIVNIDDLYIQFNRPVGPTAGLLPEDSNKVTVTLQSSMNYGTQSYKLGESLGAGDSMEHGVHIVRVLEVNLDAQPPYARIGVSHKDSTFSPTAAPTTPTDPPSMSPTTLPSSSPTSTPTASPTVAASGTPTGIPTSSPTSTPTASPTVAASGTPTGIPTSSPTSTPTASPTVAASSTPTGVPTSSPTSSPTASPTVTASSTPTGVPTSSPTSSPTASPTVTASGAPTGVPTSSPTSAPSGSPTVTPSDLVIYEILPNPETENDKNAEYIKLFNPSAVESVVLSEYQVYDATSNRYSTLGNKVLGPRETFVLCRNKSWFDNADTSLRPVGAAEGCDLQGYFVLHDRLSTILLEKRDGSVDGVDFYEEIDSVQAVEAIKHGDEVYRRLSAETNVEPECATCFDWVSAYENDVVV